MSHISINMENMPIEVIESQEINPLISKCQIKVCYVGDEPNRNRSIITKDVAREIAPTLRGCAVVGYYNENTEDFEEHNRVIDISNGKFQIKDTTRPYGFVPTDAKVWFQWFEDDGIAHEYLMTEAYIWTGQYPESQRIIEHGNNQSMELDTDTLDAYWTKDVNGKPQFFIINEAIISKLCILGEDFEPCFEGASITNVQFSLDDGFKDKLFSMLKTMQEILSKDEGGTPVLNTYAVEIGCSLWDAIYDYLWERDLRDYSIDGIYEEGSQKFVILRNRTDLTYYRLDFSLTEENGFVPAAEIVKVAPEFKPAENPQFALAEVEAYEAKYAESKVEKQEDPAPVTEPEVEPVAVEEPETVVDHASVEPEAVESAVPAEPEVVEVEPAVEPVFVEQTEPVVEETPVIEDEKNKYNLEEVVEYQELLEKYTALESKCNKLNAQIENYNAQVTELNAKVENLTNENNSLAEFKLKVDRDKKQELINSFYMLSDELKKDCVDNIDTYSYDDIEAKLSVICVRNKVSFDLDKPETKEVVFNLESVDNELDVSVPAWVQRVQEVAKEKNI